MLGFFGGTPAPFDKDVERVTDEKTNREDWGLIMDLCDKVKGSPTGPKDCLKSIQRRLAHPDPHVVMLSITVLDACVSNCGKPFMLEVASRDFENEFRKLLNKSQPKIQDRLRGLLRKWAEGDFKSDSQLCLIPSLYNALKQEGMDFSGGEAASAQRKKAAALGNPNPNAVFSQEEEDDIAKAIQLSLQDGKGSSNGGASKPTGKSSLYPSTLDDSLAIGGGESNAPGASSKKSLKARALYDFEAAEDNELTFKAGEIVVILDHSDANWWKGSNYRGEGLFPSNFVTMDLDDSAGEEKMRGQSVQFNEDVEVNTLNQSPELVPEINEEKLDAVLSLLHEADPTCLEDDSPKLNELEKSVNAMGPLIDAELEVVDRKHAELTRLSTELVDALNLYHQLMRETPLQHHQQVPVSMYGQIPGNGFSGNPHYPAPPAMYSLGGPIPGGMPHPSYIPPGMPMNDSYGPPSMGGGPPPPGGADSIHFVSSAPPPTPPLASEPQPPPPMYANHPPPPMMNGDVPPSSLPPQYSPYMQQQPYPTQQIM